MVFVKVLQPQSICLELYIIEENMQYSRMKPLPNPLVYHTKKSKQPDHLFNLINKVKTEPIHPQLDSSSSSPTAIKKKIMQKRIDAILKSSPTQSKVSDPVPYVKKKWTSPLDSKDQNAPFYHESVRKEAKEHSKEQQKEEIKKMVKILDLNKKLKYFGQYLQVESQGKEKQIQVAHIKEHDSKMAYLQRRMNQIKKTLRPKLCILNFSLQQKMTFINYLQNDEFFHNVIRKHDEELVRLLNASLMNNGIFNVSSLMTFYSIFVWQVADKKQQIEFVCRVLMKQLNERSINEIGRTIDLVCSKISLDSFNKSLENFNEIMKKLLFGDDYVFADRREYYLTRKALMESLDRNEECISIFINIFYAG